MNRVDFEKKLRAEGYTEIFDRELEADHFNAEHTHDFDACLFIIEGEITIAPQGKPEIFRAGGICSVAAGTPHTERCGPAGVRYLVGWRYKT
jgi:quercetin dioxygenase-like cupin family protein